MTQQFTTEVDKAAYYCREVINNNIPACWQVKAAVQRHLDDLQKQDNEDFKFYFDEESAERVLQFFKFCKHSKGPTAGKPFVAEPWQAFIVSNIFGWKHKSSGLRRFRTALIMIPRKNGKDLALDTAILTTKGWSTMGDLKVGEYVFGADGQPTKIVATSEIFTDNACYDIGFSGTDETITAGADHEWLVIDNCNYSKNNTVIKTTKEIHDSLYKDAKKKECRYKIKLPAPIKKITNKTKQCRAAHRQITSCKKVKTVNTKCIEVDNNDHLYLAGKSLIPTHNSYLSSAIALYAMMKDNEATPEIYTVASKRDQAKIVLDESRRIASYSPALKKRLKILSHTIEARQGFGKMQSLSADANTLDGLNPHLIVNDEFHAQRGNELYDVLISAFGARKQPLMLNISTAGNNISCKCFEMQQYVEQILKQDIVDDSTFGIVYALDKDDDWSDPTNLQKSNPNLGVSVFEDYLVQQLEQAKNIPSQKSNFLIKHCNVWTSGASLWCNTSKWLDCADDYTEDDFNLSEISEAYIAFDLSSTTDLTSVSVVIILNNGEWRILNKSFLPSETVANNQQYLRWVESGHLISTDGPVVDYDIVYEHIKDWWQRFNVNEIGYDSWNSTAIISKLVEEDAPLVTFTQGFKSFSPAMKELERRYLNKQIIHNNNPVLNWAMNNLAVKSDPAGNIKPIKNNTNLRIDPAVATIMAVGIASLNTGDSFNADDFNNYIMQPTL